MEKARLRKLAGIVLKENNDDPIVDTVLDGLKFSNEMQLRKLLKEHNIVADVDSFRGTAIVSMKQSEHGLVESLVSDWDAIKRGTDQKSTNDVEIISIEEKEIEDATMISEEDAASGDGEQVLTLDATLQPLDEPTEKDKEDDVKVVMPKEVKDAIVKRVKELKDAIDKYDNKGYNDISQKGKAVEALDKIVELVASETMKGLKEAILYYNSLMNPITDLFPSNLIVWLTDKR